MALTRDYHATIRERVRRDPEFREGLLHEALAALDRGEPEVARILLADALA